LPAWQDDRRRRSTTRREGALPAGFDDPEFLNVLRRQMLNFARLWLVRP
jgi:hypothetical protein